MMHKPLDTLPAPRVAGALDAVRLVRATATGWPPSLVLNWHHLSAAQRDGLMDAMEAAVLDLDVEDDARQLVRASLAPPDRFRRFHTGENRP